jgi:hypothetical protein
MPEIECPQCGHRALSVATRCPRCGHEFPPNLIQPLPSTADRHWVRWSVMAVAALALILAIGRYGRYESATNKPPRPAAAAVEVADTTSRDTARRDSLPQKPPPSRPPPQPPPAPERAAAQPQQRSPQPPPAVAPVTQQTVPTGNQEQRYATVFVNVRRSPSAGSTTVAVLNPGDAVLVDSLRRGWYRIIRDGRVLGYADRRYLSTTPR